jgi:dihydroorotase
VIVADRRRPAPGPAGADAEIVDGDGPCRAARAWSTCTPTCASPGREDAETVASGTRAAALGGYTAVFAMANTDPTADTAGVVEQVYRLGRDVGLVDVHPIGAVSVGWRGERLAELAAMADSRPGCGCSPTTATASPTRC